MEKNIGSNSYNFAKIDDIFRHKKKDVTLNFPQLLLLEGKQRETSSFTYNLTNVNAF